MNDYKKIKIAYLKDTGYIKENFESKENFSESNDKLEVKLAELKIVNNIQNWTIIDINNASVYGDMNDKKLNYEFYLQFTLWTFRFLKKIK